MPNSLDFKIFHSVSEVDPASWDQLSAGRPFTSHQWYRYGETVMADCLPIYLIVYQHDQPIARATFWRVANDPLPIQAGLIRQGVEALIRRWPLLICRSPIASLSGLIMPDDVELRSTVQKIINTQADKFLHETGCSFLTLEYLAQKEQTGWPESLMLVSALDPGTIMPITWPSFDAYLNSGNKKDRQHYKRTIREAEKLGIEISQDCRVDRLEEALSLIRGVELRFGSAPNPWTRAMLENIEMVNGIFLSASIKGEMVGCGLILQDNSSQMNAALGLAVNTQYVYFTLVYESMKVAFDKNISLLRMGSGAYDVKQQLGFSLEDNNCLLYTAANPLLQKTGLWLSKFS